MEIDEVKTHKTATTETTAATAATDEATIGVMTDINPSHAEELSNDGQSGNRCSNGKRKTPKSLRPQKSLRHRNP